MRENLKKFLESEVPNIDLASPLIEQIGSLDFLSLISRLEKQYIVNFQGEDLSFDNFSSFENLFQLIEKKTKKSP